MNEKSLAVIAQIKAKSGKESQVRQELLPRVAPNRADAGCLNPKHPDAKTRRLA